MAKKHRPGLDSTAARARRTTEKTLMAIFVITFTAVTAIGVLDLAFDLPVPDAYLSVVRSGLWLALTAVLVARSTAHSHIAVERAGDHVIERVKGEVGGIVAELTRIRLVEREMDVVMGTIVRRLGRVDAAAAQAEQRHEELMARFDALETSVQKWVQQARDEGFLDGMDGHEDPPAGPGLRPVR